MFMHVVHMHGMWHLIVYHNLLTYYPLGHLAGFQVFPPHYYKQGHLASSNPHPLEHMYKGFLGVGLLTLKGINLANWCQKC